MFRPRAEPGGDQQRAELVAVQSGGVGFVVQARPANMRGGRMIEQILPRPRTGRTGDGAQPPGDGGPGAAAGFQVAGGAFDVGATGPEQAELVLVAPAGELAQVHLVRPAGQAAAGGEEPANASRFALVKTGATGTRAADGVVVAIGHLRGSG